MTGISGRIAHTFIHTQLTPLLAVAGMLLGFFAILVTPREEEPQIDVTMASVTVPFIGASPVEVERLVASPLEKLLHELEGVEHIYSVSSPGVAIVTVQFEVGVARQEALVRLHNAIQSNRDWRPAGMGVGEPIIKPQGIDDVPVIALTLYSDDPAQSSTQLRQLAGGLAQQLKRIEGTRNIEVIGGHTPTIEIQLDPQQLAAHGLSLSQVRHVLQASHSVRQAGAVVSDNQLTPVTAGEFITSAQELAQLVVGNHQGKSIYLADIALVSQMHSEPHNYVWFSDPQHYRQASAVTLTIAKKPGENAVEIADQVLAQVEQLKGYLIPDNVQVNISRNYGQTANDKASKLIQKLIFATLSVIALVWLALGWREATVIGAAVVLTLMLTLFASWAWGFTLNRVSLFALIFSIGILVDDAIVVVENIHRHRLLSNKPLHELIPEAVNEVGGPTILATLTVIAALLPMAFVSGLMGPYMSPIPINASMGMLISLLIALSFTPWLSSKLLTANVHADGPMEGRLSRFFHALMTPFLGTHKRRNRYFLGLALVAMIAAAMALVVTQHVILKMLPFDNKSEFELVVDMPEGTPLEQTNRVLAELAASLLQSDEVRNVQGYAGTAAPIGFNGLVRQYGLRQQPHLGQLQVNLLDKHQRERSSHAIALALRPQLAAIAQRHQATLKLVEVPPGPPVMAPIVAQVYGPDYEGQMAVASKLAQALGKQANVTDVDTSIEASSPRWVMRVDRQRAAQLGISQANVVAAITTALAGEEVIYLPASAGRDPLAVRLTLPGVDKANLDRLLTLPIQGMTGQQVTLANLVTVEQHQWQSSIYHKDLLPVVYVSADIAGGTDSPLYAMFAQASDWWDGAYSQLFIKAPMLNQDYQIKWDGEWQITYETFRDMGAAYAVGLLLIYLLVVGQFASYWVPLIIMAPIPLTLAGILPGHALLGAQFTATSMIGMIALAGIIVRNSILLVDFINQQLAAGVALEKAVVQAASVRTKPILLTALAAMLGAVFILDDPIFNGLAISLIFGLLVSTLLTLVVIPLLYYSLLRRQFARR